MAEVTAGWGKVGGAKVRVAAGVTYIIQVLPKQRIVGAAALYQLRYLRPARGRYALTDWMSGALMSTLTKWHSVLDRSEELPSAHFAKVLRTNHHRPVRRGHISCHSMCRTVWSRDPKFGATELRSYQPSAPR